MKDLPGSLYTHREQRPSLADEIKKEELGVPRSGDELLGKLKNMRRRRALMRRVVVLVALVYAAGLATYIALLLTHKSVERSERVAAAMVRGPAAPSGTGKPYDPPAMRLAIAQWKKTADQLREARLWIQKGRLDTASSLLKEALARNPNNGEVLFELGQLSLQQRDLPSARDYLQRVLTEEPQRKAAIEMLATVYSRSGLHEQALAVANWILETDPDALEAHRVAGLAYLHTNRLDLALGHFRTCALAEPENIPAQKQYADVLVALKGYEKAGALYEGILKKKPDEADAYRQLAICYAKQTLVEQTVATMIQAKYNLGAGKVTPWFKDPGFAGVHTQKLFALLEKQMTIPAAPKMRKNEGGDQVEAENEADAQRLQKIQDMMKDGR